MEQQQRTVSPIRSRSNSRGEARRILVVDDAVDSREILKEFLRRQGHEVCVAGDGLEGLVVASKFRPQIVFLDIRMPRMDGFELCMRLRSNRLTQDAAVFALTGGSYNGQIPADASGRFDAYLRKPIEWDVIEGLVRGAATPL